MRCPLCRGAEARRLFESRDRVHKLPGAFTVFRCNGCYAVFYRPALEDHELLTYYPDHYGRYRYSRKLDKKEYRGARRFILENRYHYPLRRGGSPSLAKKWLAMMLSLVMARDAIPYLGNGKFLDVGCGGGSYMYRLRRWGWDVYGVEPSPAGAAQARSLGLSVHCGSVEDAGFADDFFDLVRINHVLEHLANPRRTMDVIRRVLKPSGIVYVTVPNSRSFNFWLFRSNWYALDVPRHVISYSPRTLKFLFDATGFEMVRLRYRSGPFNFVRSVQYYLEENGARWPSWVRRIDWPRNKAIRRTLKPIFFFIDRIRWGDTMEIVLRKSPDAPCFMP